MKYPYDPEQAREYYLENRDRIKARALNYYRENSERMKEKARLWRKNNPEKRGHYYINRKNNLEIVLHDRERNKKLRIKQIATETPEIKEIRRQRARDRMAKYKEAHKELIAFREKRKKWIEWHLMRMARDDGTYDALVREYGQIAELN